MSAQPASSTSDREVLALLVEANAAADDANRRHDAYVQAVAASTQELSDGITARMVELREAEASLTTWEHDARVCGEIIAHQINADAEAAAKATRLEADTYASERRNEARRVMADATTQIEQKQRELETNVAAHLAEMEAIKAARAAEHVEHVSKMQQSESATTARLADLMRAHEGQLSSMAATADQALAEKAAAHAESLKAKEVRLAALEVTEQELHARVRAIDAIVAADGSGNGLVELNVLGKQFYSPRAWLGREPRGVIAAELLRWTDAGAPGALRILGDPTHFHLILEYLHEGTLPVVADASQLQWLERQADAYHLSELSALCRDGYKRLNTVGVMQLLNGQRNLSGMDMRGLDLSKIDFRGASFYRAQLDNANLREVDLGSGSTSLQFASLIGACVDMAYLTGCSADQADFSKSSMVGSSAVGASFWKCNFREADLRNADFSRANFANADLRGVNFKGATLTDAIFTDADLRGADLSGAVCTKANFAGANLSTANLTSANLERATLTSACLEEANLSSANLASARLDQANLAEANLEEANLTSAKLSSANLSLANLTSANLTKAELGKADLTSANLLSANLSSANLTSADLTSANLLSADLSSANLTSANLSSANLTKARLKSANLQSVIFMLTNFEGAHLNSNARYTFAAGRHYTGTPIFDSW